MAAAQNVSGNVNINLAFTQVQTSGVVGPNVGTNSQSLTELISIADQLVNGTGAAKNSDLLYASQLSLTATTSTLHFGNATAKDPFGNTISMARIRLIACQVVDATSGHDVKLYTAAANGIPWLPPSTSALEARANGGLLVVYDPNSSGAGVGNTISATTDGLTIDAGSNTVTGINLVVVGDSVA